MYENRIKHLEESHHLLDKKIDQMERSGNFKDLELSKLKKMRLTLKDEIAILKHKQELHNIEHGK